jgi:glucose-6-phosphate dehydrogenase assembly protein OpcA
MASGSLAERLQRLRQGYTRGDTDLAWTRITRWRAHLAAILDQPPFEPVTRVVIAGQENQPSVDLLAAWLGWKLRCPVQLIRQAHVGGLTRAELHRPSGVVAIDRPKGSQEATLIVPGSADQPFHLSLPTLADCLSEELRRLDEDRVYGEVIEQGLPWLAEAERRAEISGDDGLTQPRSDGADE